MAQAELFWALLHGAYPLKDLKKVNLEGFDWSGRSTDGKTVLVAYIENALLHPQERFEDALNSIEWLIRSGASIAQKCSGGKSSLSQEFDDADTEREVHCKGRTAISFVSAWHELLKEEEDDWDWDAEVNFLRGVMSCFAEASDSLTDLPAVRRRVSIDEGIAAVWEKSLAAKDSHDLTIETADGVVTAHAHMLKVVSSVVTAMLQSPMKEGKAQRIEIKDTSSKAVSLLLEILGGVIRILYTCSVQEGLDYQTALGALDLAHRWQVEVVVAILTDLLAGMITDESFPAIGEHAVLKGLERLKAAAQRFGAESKKVQADLKAGRLPAVVAQLFPAALKASKSNEPKPKRRYIERAVSRHVVGVELYFDDGFHQHVSKAWVTQRIRDWHSQVSELSPGDVVIAHFKRPGKHQRSEQTDRGIVVTILPRGEVSVTFQDDITQVIPKGWIEEVASRWTGQRNSFSKEVEISSLESNKRQSSTPPPPVPSNGLAECVICFDARPNGVIVHGETCHQSTCFGCAKKLQLAGGTCPICRAGAPRCRAVMFRDRSRAVLNGSLPGDHRPSLQVAWRLSAHGSVADLEAGLTRRAAESIHHGLGKDFTRFCRMTMKGPEDYRTIRLEPGIIRCQRAEAWHSGRWKPPMGATWSFSFALAVEKTANCFVNVGLVEWLAARQESEGSTEHDPESLAEVLKAPVFGSNLEK
eukprot:s1324_g11.t1